MDETWMLDEIAHAGPEHLDPGFVAGYDRKQGTDPADAVAILRRYGLGRESTLVDLAAGTGTLTVAAAPWCRQVIAVDVSPVMAGFRRERVEAAGLRNVRCVQAGFYDFRPAEAAGVFASWFGGAADAPAAGYTREDFAEHIRTEYSTFRWLFEPMLAATGFRIAEAEYWESTYGSYVCVKT